MSKTYKIRDGFSFVCADNGVMTGGEFITLDDDVAVLHLHKLDGEVGELAPLLPDHAESVMLPQHAEAQEA